jgi:hypothetical protein
MKIEIDCTKKECDEILVELPPREAENLRDFRPFPPNKPTEYRAQVARLGVFLVWASSQVPLLKMRWVALFTFLFAGKVK